MSFDALASALNRPLQLQESATPMDDALAIRAVDRTESIQSGTLRQYVDISPMGKALSLANGKTGKARNDDDIDKSSLPGGVKELLKRIRDLNEQIQQKMIELRQIQANQRLNEQERAQALERVQAELSSLNGALVKANAMLLKAMDDAELGGDARMEVAQLLMK